MPYDIRFPRSHQLVLRHPESGSLPSSNSPKTPRLCVQHSPPRPHAPARANRRQFLPAQKRHRKPAAYERFVPLRRLGPTGRVAIHIYGPQTNRSPATCSFAPQPDRPGPYRPKRKSDSTRVNDVQKNFQQLSKLSTPRARHSVRLRLRYAAAPRSGKNIVQQYTITSDPKREPENLRNAAGIRRIPAGLAQKRR